MERVFNENLYSKRGYFNKLSAFELDFFFGKCKLKKLGVNSKSKVYFFEISWKKSVKKVGKVV